MTTINPALEAMTDRSRMMAELDAKMMDFARWAGVVCGNCVLPDGVAARARYINPGCIGPVAPKDPGSPAREYTGERCPVFQHPVTGAIDFCLGPDGRAYSSP